MTETTAPCWIELLTPDVEAATAFCSAVFGWTAEDTGLGDQPYRTMRLGGDRVAGITTSASPGGPAVWNLYFSTDDAEAGAARAVAAGGQVLVPVRRVGDLGTVSEVVDPGGAAVGLWQPGTHPGFERSGEPGTPVWFELHTRSFVAAVDFYGSLFGWEAETVVDTGTVRYATVTVEGHDIVGIFDASEEIPAGLASFWGVYLGTADADATVAAAVAAGGSVLHAPIVTPSGRMATIADPNGAIFRIRESAPPRA